MKAGRRGRLMAGGLLAVGLLALFLRGLDWAALAGAFRSAHPGYLLAVPGATVVMYAARAWRWGYLLAPLARVPLHRLFSITVVGFMTGLLVPRAQEVVRPFLVGRGYGIRTSAAFASIILERLVDLITVLLLFFLYLYVLPMPATQARGPLLGSLKAAGGIAALAALAVLVVLFTFHVHGEWAMGFFDRILARLPLGVGRPLGEGLRAFGEGLAVLQAPIPHLLAVLGQSFLVWLLIDLSVYLNNRAFGVDLPFHSTFLMIGFLTVGVAVPTPGMVGGYHVAYREALTQAFGVPAGTAAAAGIAGHALSNLPVLILGLLLFHREGLTLERVAEMTEGEPPPATSDGGGGGGSLAPPAGSGESGSPGHKAQSAELRRAAQFREDAARRV